MNQKNRVEHFMKVQGLILYFRVRLEVFYKETLYLTVLKENAPEIYMQLQRRDIHWK